MPKRLRVFMAVGIRSYVRMLIFLRGCKGSYIFPFVSDFASYVRHKIMLKVLGVYSIHTEMGTYFYICLFGIYSLLRVSV